MRRWKLMLLVCCIFAFSTAESSAQTLGVYFDIGGVNPNYSPENITFPCQLQAYVVAKGFDETHGVVGWECRLNWSDSLFVSVESLSSQSVNIGTFPNFMVGMAQPAGIGAPMAILATLNIVAIGRGELSLAAGTPCSIPASELPVLCVNGALVPAGYEYGNANEPCASIGGSVNRTSEDEEIVLVSQHSRMEYRDGEVYAYSDLEKSWTAMPKFQSVNEIIMSSEDLRNTALVPRMLPIVANKTTGNKSTVILHDDFERYRTPSASAFLPAPGYAALFNSYTGPISSENIATQWGVVNSRHSSGAKSAYCNAIKKYCTSWNPPTGCSSGYVAEEVYERNIVSSMNAVQRFAFGEGVPRVTFRLYSDIGGSETWPEDYDYLLVFVQTPVGGFHVLHSVWYSTDWRSVAADLPVNLPDDTDLFFAFFADDFDGGNAGVYVDDVTVEIFDSDIRISSVLWSGTVYDAAEPNVYTLTIQNTGAIPTGEFSIAYNRGPFLDINALEGFQVVPSIAGYSTSEIQVQIPFPAQKTFNETISQTVHFMIDALGEIPEGGGEADNYYTSCLISWTIPNAPVILVHGLLGGALGKVVDGNRAQVYGSNLVKDVETFLLRPELLARRANTNVEVTDEPMYTPSAYPPEQGFIREYFTPVPAVHTQNPSPLDQRLWIPGVSIPVFTDLWEPLIENLVDSPYSDGEYILPDHDPSASSYHEQDLFLFNYDWRLDLNPDRNMSLNGSSSAYARMDSLINWIQLRHPGKDRLTVVTHSMGGLFVEAYLRSRPASHGVSRWIALGAPFQGSEMAMALLLGHTDVFGPAGMFASSQGPDLFQEFPSLWELLPTGHSDLNARTVAGSWESPRPFWFDGSASNWLWPFRRVSFPLAYGNYRPMSVLKDNPGAFGDWYDNSAAADYSRAMQNSYMSITPTNKISNVDTWLIAGKTNGSTLRGVARFGMPSPSKPDPNVQSYNIIAHELVRGPGDNIVSTWSATEVNVAEANLHRRYIGGADHWDLIRDPRVGGFIADLIRGKDLSSHIDIEQVEPAGPNRSEPWYIRWHTDAAVWMNKAGDKTSVMLNAPVSLELVQIDPAQPENNRVVVGLIHYPSPIGGPGDPQSFCQSLDPRFSLSEIGDDIIIASNSPDAMHLRLYIRPSPALWDPAASPPVKADLNKTVPDFTVLGHLYLKDLDYTYAFPSEEYDSTPFIRFNDIRYYGFGAYVDFTIQNGNVAPGLRLTLIVDGDGDGQEDMQVSAVPATEASLPVQRDTVLCSPNPLNGGGVIEWGLASGRAELVEVYDIAGRRVRSWIAASEMSGRQYFDGKSDDGKRLPSGVYLVAIKDNTGMIRAQTTITVVK